MLSCHTCSVSEGVGEVQWGRPPGPACPALLCREWLPGAGRALLPLAGTPALASPWDRLCCDGFLPASARRVGRACKLCSISWSRNRLNGTAGSPSLLPGAACSTAAVPLGGPAAVTAAAAGVAATSGTPGSPRRPAAEGDSKEPPPLPACAETPAGQRRWALAAQVVFNLIRHRYAEGPACGCCSSGPGAIRMSARGLTHIVEMVMCSRHAQRPFGRQQHWRLWSLPD